MALLMTLALALAACSDSGTGTDGRAAGAGTTGSSEATLPAAEKFTGTDFYAEPDEVPDVPHGTLIRYQPWENVQVANATMYRVMYTSEDVGGAPILVTGVVGIPTAAAPDGGRQVVTLAHGTTGIADECAPSKATGGRAVFGMTPFLDAGYLVAETDYEGLGTVGRHPYLVGESEGRGVLDAAIAAEQLPGADGGDQLAVFGYSQGGHGALWAGQLVTEWAPDFHLVGTVAGAPATELPLIFGAGGRANVAGFLYMIIAGFHDAYPDAPLSDVLTPQGEAELDAVDQGCAGEVLGHFAGLDSSQLLVADGAETEPWKSLAEENNPGNVATDSPILILHSAHDDVVPVALSALLFDRLCGLGQEVERRVYENGGGHGATAPTALADGAAWIQQRFGGQPAISTCPPSGG
jgi:pimeloyl-ACP methyl ester carboxylesterase